MKFHKSSAFKFKTDYSNCMGISAGDFFKPAYAKQNILEAISCEFLSYCEIVDIGFWKEGFCDGQVA
jgi:hypothetical protein